MGDAGKPGDRDGNEGEGGAGARDEEWTSEIRPEATVYRRCRRPEDAAADQSHPNRHHEFGRDAGDERLRESRECDRRDRGGEPDRKSTRLNSSHVEISYA